MVLIVGGIFHCIIWRSAWHLIARIYPDEYAAVSRAVTLVGNNKWYGYRKDLGDVRSSLYKHFSWVCGRILIEVGGEKSLEQYRGFVAHKAMAGKVSEIIAAYIRASEQPNVTAEASEREARNNLEFIRLVCGYPAATAPQGAPRE